MAVETVFGCIPFAFPALPGIRCVFTTRERGTLSFYQLDDKERERVAAARKTLCNDLGVTQWTELMQVHGDTFIINPETTLVETESALKADGHSTDRKNHALCIKTADCQPIFLAHPKGYIGAMHVGWRGNTLNFINTAVDSFCRNYGLDPTEVCAVRGPSLGNAEFVNFDSEWPKEYSPWYNPATHRVDLWALTRWQLGEAGLKPQNMYSLDVCTYSVNSVFFSYRRKDAGRQMGLIWME